LTSVFFRVNFLARSLKGQAYMIEEYLSQNESKTVEFKENTKSLSGIVKTKERLLEV
jgi:hypothetical protein